jgi:hypothetical protein
MVEMIEIAAEAKQTIQSLMGKMLALKEHL